MFFHFFWQSCNLKFWLLDTDDCLEDENLCGPHGTCLNVEGSFECDCPVGFARTEDGKACKGTPKNMSDLI